MIRGFLPLLIVGILATACVPQGQLSSNGTGVTSGTTTGTTTGGSTSGSSCADFSGFTSLASCKQSTFAQCYPSTKIVNNQTAVCYFPVAGWDQCANNQAQWSYSSWGNWCAESYSVLKRSRTATCQRPVSACDCVTDSKTEERCSVVPGGAFPLCTGINTQVIACNATPTPSPTPTPSATPSMCNTVVLNYQVTDGSSHGFLLDVISAKYPAIRDYFTSRGYKIATTRGSSYSLAVGGPITNDLVSNHYVIQVEGIKWGCFIGSNARVTFKIIKNGVTISAAEGGAGCISLKGLSATATQKALDNLNAPYCQ